MYIDKELLICNEQSICNEGTTEYSEYAIDTSVAKNIAKGRPLYMVIVVDEVFAGTGTTLTISLVTATNTNLTTGQVVLLSTPAIAKGSLTAGRIPIVLALPPLPESGGAQQFLGLNFVGDTTFETTGKVTAFLALDPTTNF